METTAMDLVRRLRRQSEHKTWQEIVALAGGSALAVVGLLKKSAGGAALAAAGGFLVYRSATSDRPLTGLIPHGSRHPVRARVAVTINKPAGEIYSFFRNFENLPKFMSHLESVRSNGTRSTWKARAPLGRHVEWEAEITDERENERIAWRTADDASVPNWGRVLFLPAPGGRGTELRVEMEYLPPAGEVGRWFAKLMGEEPELQIRDDIRHLKQLLETGEIATTEGQPSGRRSTLVHAASRYMPQMAKDRELERAV